MSAGDYNFGQNVNFNRNQALLFRLQNLASDPTGVLGQKYFNTATGKERLCTVAGSPGTWVDIVTGSGAPSGAAGGVLSGTYPSPGFAGSPTFTGVVTGPTINATTGFQVSGVALASTNLSDTAALARLAGPTFTGTVTIPTLNVTTAYQVSGVPLASTHLSDSADIAHLSGTQTFTGDKSFSGYIIANTQILASRASSTSILQFQHNSDSEIRLTVYSDGKMEWGSGALAPDTTVTRLSAGVLKVDNYVSATSGFRVNNVALASTHLSDTAALARLAGPTFTGTTTASTLNVTTAYQFGGVALASTHLSDSAALARLASPTFTGTLTAPTINATTGYQVSGVALASTNLSDTADLAHLSGTQTFSGTKTFSSVVTVADGVSAGHAVNLGQLTSAITVAQQGQSVKTPARAVSTTNITLSAPQTVDGVSVIAGDRVLVTGQSTGANNGLYVVAAGAWTRATDADTSAEVPPGTFVLVTEGTTYADTQWVLTTNGPITLGSTSLTFTQYGSPGTITATAPIVKTGNAISVSFDSTLRNNSGSLGVNTGAIDATFISSTLKPSGSAAAGTEALRALGSSASTAMAGNTRLDQVPAPTASVSLNNQLITNLATPVSLADAATKYYVDNKMLVQQQVQAVATSNIALTGLLTINGRTLVAGDRVLVLGQTTTAQDGVYVAAVGAWSRSADFPSGYRQSDIMHFLAEKGSVAGQLWMAQIQGTNYVNTDDWTGFSIAADPANFSTVVPLTKGGLGVDASSTSGARTARGSLIAAGKFTMTLNTSAGTATSFNVDHALTGSTGSPAKVAVLYQVGGTGNFEEWHPGVEVSSSVADRVILTFGTAPTASDVVKVIVVA